MNFFLDTEFIESGPRMPIQLISIGMVTESGKRFYAISSQFNPDDASEWVKENVLAQLEPESEVQRLTLTEIGAAILIFVHDNLPEGEKPRFWGYFADYDWVVFCQIFGTMMNLPKDFPMFCRDIRQLADDYGNPELPTQDKGEHNALADAEWNRAAWRFLMGISIEVKKRQNPIYVIRPTHTYAILEVSQTAFTEVEGLLIDAGYGHAFGYDDDAPIIDMFGIALKANAAVPSGNS